MKILRRLSNINAYLAYHLFVLINLIILIVFETILKGFSSENFTNIAYNWTKSIFIVIYPLFIVCFALFILTIFFAVYEYIKGPIIKNKIISNNVFIKLIEIFILIKVAIILIISLSIYF